MFVGASTPNERRTGDTPHVTCQTSSESNPRCYDAAPMTAMCAESNDSAFQRARSGIRVAPPQRAIRWKENMMTHDTSSRRHSSVRMQITTERIG